MQYPNLAYRGMIPTMVPGPVPQMPVPQRTYLPHPVNGVPPLGLHRPHMQGPPGYMVVAPVPMRPAPIVMPPLLTSTPSTHLNVEDTQDRVPMDCNNQHYNMNEMLAQKILSAEYFISLNEYKTFEEVVDGIYEEVTHLRPYMLGKSGLPSAASCFLYKLFVMRLTYPQLKKLISHKDSPYIRGVGFLYIRYVVTPKKIVEWYDSHVNDPTMFCPSGIESEKETLGQFVQKLVTDINYYGTILRRIPIPIVRAFKKTMLEQELRTAKNLSLKKKLKIGDKVNASYSKDGAFYEAVIDEITQKGLLVTYTEYSNQEEVDMSRVKIPPALLETMNKRRKQHSRSQSRGRDRRDRDRRRSRSRSRGRRSRSRGRRSRSRGRRSRSRGRRSRNRDRHRPRKKRVQSPSVSPAKEIDLAKEVLRRERESAVTGGRDYARHIVGYKRMLSQPIGMRRSPTPPWRRGNPSRRHHHVRSPERSVSPKREELTKAFSQEARNRLANLKDTYGELRNKPNKSDFELK